MRKCDSYLTFSCYKYAPESFKAYKVTGFSNGNHNKPIYEQIRLSYEDMQKCGYEFCTKGRKAAISKLKSILRKQEKRTIQYCTIGFFEENGRQYYFDSHSSANNASMSEKLKVYKDFKRYLLGRNCEVVICTEAKLGANYQVESKRDNIAKVDINRPCKIYYKQAALC